jgi:hypothetical protein
LTNEASIDWSIEKYHKIEKNDGTILTVNDDLAMTTGTYDYIIRFIECFINKHAFNYSQVLYYWDQENWKNGYSIELEEV